MFRQARRGIPAAVRPELALVLCCARTHMEPGSVLRLETLVSSSLDWDFLIRCATTHGILPLLHRHVSELCPQAVPATIQGRLRQAVMVSAQRNLLLASELRRVLDALKACGILAVPFKGATLAQSVYGDISLRPFSDNDILVRRDQAERCFQVLTSLGYARSADEWTERDDLLVRWGGDVLYRRQGQMLDVQWRLTPPYYPHPLDIGWLERRLTTLAMLGDHVVCMAPEDLMLFLLIHGGKHAWFRLSWMCDIAEMARECPGLDWDAVFRRARETGSERAVVVGLRVVDAILGHALPAEPFGRVGRDASAGRLAAEVQERLTARPLEHPTRSELLLFQFKIGDRRRDQLAELARGLLSKPLWEATIFRLPRGLEFLYFVVRPFRLITKYLPFLLRQILRVRARSKAPE